MNNATSEIAIVTKSMPPSRKLIATNGAMAANNVVSLTRLRHQLADDDAPGRQRGQRDEIERLLDALAAQRAERAERHDREPEKRRGSP